MAAFIEVTLRSFETYKGRADVKQNSWFRCSNRLLEDPDFFDFEPAEILVWIHILSLSSQKNSATVRVNFEYCVRVLRIKKSIVESAVKKLMENQLLPADVTSTLRARNVHDTSTGATNKQTDITDKQTNTPVFDFESLYESYPNKINKAEGIRRLTEQITSPQIFADFSQAIENYKRFLELPKNAGWLKAKQFDVFVGPKTREVKPWREWVNPDPSVYESPQESKPRNAGADLSPWLTEASHMFTAIKTFGAGNPDFQNYIGPIRYAWYLAIGGSRIRAMKDDSFGRSELAKLIKAASEQNQQKEIA